MTTLEDKLMNNEATASKLKAGQEEMQRKVAALAEELTVGKSLDTLGLPPALEEQLRNAHVSIHAVVEQGIVAECKKFMKGCNVIRKMTGEPENMYPTIVRKLAELCIENALNVEEVQRIAVAAGITTEKNKPVVQ